jgi:alkylation response protein AidB-like acyl-CoA dehydrogenase
MRRKIFDDEHRQFRDTVRAFLLREATSRSKDWEEAGYVDPTFWCQAAAAGLLGLAVPVKYGGSGLSDYRFNVIVDEEICYCDVVGDYPLLANDIVGPYLTDLTTEEQKARWLPAFANGTLVAAIAMSEPDAGSDLRGIHTQADSDGRDWVLNGTKTFVTSGIQAGVVIVFARVKPERGDGFGLFVVEEGMKGFTKGRKLSKIGRRASDTAELFMSEVRVPEENVLGEVGRGFEYLMRNLPRERLAMAVTAVASGERALELALAYAGERRAFGKPIGNFQAVRFALAEMKTELEVGRSYIDRCIAAANDGELTAAEAAGAKFWTTELQNRVIDTCLQIHGGYGYMEEYPIARMWRDARVQRIYGGTNEIMREIVGRSLGF